MACDACPKSNSFIPDGQKAKGWTRVTLMRDILLQSGGTTSVQTVGDNYAICPDCTNNNMLEALRAVTRQFEAKLQGGVHR